MVTGRQRRSIDGKFARVKNVVFLVCSPVSRQLHRCLIAMRGGKRRWVKITVALSALFLPLAVSAPAFAYNGPAAASYADTWALSNNPNYLTFGDDCTNFVSQALNAGGLPTITATSTTSDDHYWFFLFTSKYRNYIYSHSWAVAYDLFTFLRNDVHGWKGTFSYDNGQNKAPAFTPDSIVTGDVLFYDWGTGEGISHASMQVGIGTDQHGYYGNLVDAHTNAEKHLFWTMKDAPGNTNWMTTTVYFMHV